MIQHFSVICARKMRPAAILCLGLAALFLGNAALALSRAELYQAAAPVADRS
jgi:hypothetical protein